MFSVLCAAPLIQLFASSHSWRSSAHPCILCYSGNSSLWGWKSPVFAVHLCFVCESSTRLHSDKSSTWLRTRTCPKHLVPDHHYALTFSSQRLTSPGCYDTDPAALVTVWKGLQEELPCLVSDAERDNAVEFLMNSLFTAQETMRVYRNLWNQCFS